MTGSVNATRGCTGIARGNRSSVVIGAPAARNLHKRGRHDSSH